MPYLRAALLPKRQPVQLEFEWGDESVNLIEEGSMELSELKEEKRSQPLKRGKRGVVSNNLQVLTILELARCGYPN